MRTKTKKRCFHFQEQKNCKLKIPDRQVHLLTHISLPPTRFKNIWSRKHAKKKYFFLNKNKNVNYKKHFKLCFSTDSINLSIRSSACTSPHPPPVCTHRSIRPRRHTRVEKRRYFFGTPRGVKSGRDVCDCGDGAVVLSAHNNAKMQPRGIGQRHARDIFPLAV